MPGTEGHQSGLVLDSQRFFRNSRILHLFMSLAMFGTGVAALVLSVDSNGTAQVPYFFSAYISGAWHIAFIIVCQVCIYYLVEDGSRSADAGTWVSVYSISSSVFVLFNVMGVVFTVVNGICIEGQMCYYDKYIAANRSMAILLIILHCVCILFSVFLAKRAHLIDAELNSDISVRLKHVLDFLRNVRGKSRKSSVTSLHAPDPSSIGSASSLRHRQSDDTTSPDLHHVLTDHEGKVMTTVEISAMKRKRANHKRSKSHPIKIIRTESIPKDIEGQVFSIYSDSEMKVSEEKKKKKIGLFRKRKKNRVAVGNAKQKPDQSDPEYSADEGSSGHQQKVNMLQTSSQNSVPSTADLSTDIVIVAPAVTDEQKNLQLQQKELQERQTQLFEEQKRLFEKQEKLQAYNGPPPYETSEGSISTTPVSEV